jgi:hypothetical protein
MEDRGVSAPMSSWSFSHSVSQPAYSTNRCLANVVNLANAAVMSHLTRISVLETTSAIWEYDPNLVDNCVLGGSLEVIASIRMIAIKVCFFCQFLFTKLESLY